MKIISKQLYVLFVALFLSGCACNFWQLSAQHQPVNKQWTMEVCTDWVHQGSEITYDSSEMVVENANQLIHEYGGKMLSSCRVLPGSVRFYRGEYIVMQIECEQPLRGTEWHPGSTPRQYIIKLDKKKYK